jgi:uncharacterized membrane protein YfcA
MEFIQGGLSAWAFWGAIAVTFMAGFVKGAVGFAMPLIMISAFSAFMPKEVALAGLVLATVSTNVHQAFRHGPGAAWASIVQYRRMIVMVCLGILVSAPLLPILPQPVLLGLLGVPVLAFALVQLAGISLKLRLEHRRRAEYALGAVGGLYGGISGVWGPPVLVYLLSVGTEKRESVRIQGVIFLIGAVVLFFAHVGSGVLNAVTIPFSAALIVPAALGMALGFRLQDKLDAEKFRRWTLVLLALTALNLVRMAAGL